MAALFGFAAVVQLDDPDPLRWTAIYGVACALCALTLASRPVPPALFFLVAIVATVWAFGIMHGGPAASDYPQMFEAWEMKSVPVEEAREAVGLLLVAGWMAVLGFRRVSAGPGRSGRGCG